MMRTLLWSLIPDPKFLVAMDSDQLAHAVMTCLRSSSEDSFSPYNLELEGAFTSGYPAEFRDTIDKVVSGAWSYLKGRGYLGQRPGDSGSSFLVITPQGERWHSNINYGNYGVAPAPTSQPLPPRPWGANELAQFTDDDLHRSMVESQPGSNDWELMKAELEHRDRKRQPRGDEDSSADIPDNPLRLLRAISTHSANSSTPVFVTDLGLGLDELAAKSAWEYLRDRNLIMTYSVPFTARINANGTDLLGKFSSAPRPISPPARATEHPVKVSGGEQNGEVFPIDKGDSFEKLDQSARNVLGRAAGISQASRSDGRVHMEHFVKGLLDESASGAQDFFQDAGLTTERIVEIIFRATGHRLTEGYTAGEPLVMPKLSKHVSAAVQSAVEYAVNSGAKLVGGIHLLRGALSVKECSVIKALAAVGMRNGEWPSAFNEPSQEISERQRKSEAETPSQISLDDPEQVNFTRESSAVEDQRRDAVAMEPDKVTADEATAAYRTTYPAFEGDLVGFDQQSFRSRLQDSLGADVYADQLAQLIAARKTPLPLSVGLFGDWGAGKSFFIRLLHQRIDELASQDNDAFSSKIVQIHFNAWHYLDTNLWANLVCEIFENLFASLERKPDIQEKVQSLKRKLAEGSALVAEAKKELTAATKARENAQQEWLIAAQTRKLTEASIRSYFDDLSNIVLNDSVIKNELKNLSLGLGLPRIGESFADLEANVTEARGLAGHFRTLVLSVLSPQGLYRRLSLLFVALIAPVAIASLVPWLLDIKNSNLSEVTRTIITVITFIGAVSAWISKQTKRGSALIGKLETAYDRVKALREQKLKGDEGSEKQRDLNNCINDEEAAGEKLKESQARVRAIETELQELTPGRRLLRFLEQRTGSDDYRQYLGLVSLVRRDFEQLSRLLVEGVEKRENSVDRIVLYIDDLDRCNSDRVVAVLEAVHLLLAFPVFAVVVAVDPRWLRSSLIEHYPVLLSSEQASLSLRYDENLERIACPQDYLEKIFQIPFQIQSIDKDGFANLVNELLKVPQESTLGAPKPTADVQPQQAMSPVGIVTELVQASTQTERTEDTTSESSSIPDQPTLQMKPAPRQVAPERLQLEKWERAAINECHPLFRTPRAVKRLVNTYCLIRVGVSEHEWDQFLGSENRPRAQYRTPLLMMAVGAAYPGLASRWLELVRRDGSWIPDLAKLSGSGVLAGRGLKYAEWCRLSEALSQITANDFAPFDQALFEEWVPRVRRYFF